MHIRLNNTKNKGIVNPSINATLVSASAIGSGSYGSGAMSSVDPEIKETLPKSSLYLMMFSISSWVSI